MPDSKLAEKLLRLGLCPGAHQGEWKSAAIKFFASLRKEGVKAEEFLALGNESHQQRQQRHHHYEEPAEMILPFGKYKGHSVAYIAQIDPSYLNWCLDNLTKINLRLRKEISSQLERYGY
jgi:hypothetical protein